jgi:hypothetical protein
MIRREHDVPVSPGGEEVAVAILLASGEAFAFTDESYNHPSWANPDLKLERGTYRVVVRASASNADVTTEFKLEYLSGNFAGFHLETF